MKNAINDCQYLFFLHTVPEVRLTRVIEGEPSVSTFTKVGEGKQPITKLTSVIESQPSSVQVTRVIEGKGPKTLVALKWFISEMEIDLPDVFLLPGAGHDAEGRLLTG